MEEKMIECPVCCAIDHVHIDDYHLQCVGCGTVFGENGQLFSHAHRQYRHAKILCTKRRRYVIVRIGIAGENERRTIHPLSTQNMPIQLTWWGRDIKSKQPLNYSEAYPVF